MNTALKIVAAASIAMMAVACSKQASAPASSAADAETRKALTYPLLPPLLTLPSLLPLRLLPLLPLRLTLLLLPLRLLPPLPSNCSAAQVTADS